MVNIYFDANGRQSTHISTELRAEGLFLAFSATHRQYFVTAHSVTDMEIISRILMRNGVIHA